MEGEVGFLGLGIMGKAMSMNLLRHGFKVTVWNRTLSRLALICFSLVYLLSKSQIAFDDVSTLQCHGPKQVRSLDIRSPSSQNLTYACYFEECDELVEHGASVAETPAAVVKKCKYTIAMLSDPSAALSVVFDKDGALEQICRGKGYIDMSTVDSDTSTKISEAITSKGGYFLEAPVSGSKKPAEDGQLVILAAGEKTLYEEALPAFDVMGKKSFFLGKVGNGAKMKLVVNMIMGRAEYIDPHLNDVHKELQSCFLLCSMMNAFSEGLILADKSGLSSQTLLDVLDLGGIANPMFKMKGPTMIQKNYSPAFPLKHQQKDMRLALALGDENSVSMPVAAASNEAFKKARSMGLGDLDFSAVFEAVKFPEGSS
ncbi:hypothetical protein RHGRI_002638 [Rhododendron griersonianum]|uniref:Uncharacterized protein n=1 Tax=Rhododendron griersonianum TaxID=479676 RepID=A0AAV6LQU5_9ERIC|nr:hypothetical protein RHGRI_002638 [Rhododendron griersonianum]